MNRLFADAAYFFALVSSDDEWHAKAVAWSKQAKGRFWTTDYVLLEFADGLAHPPFRDRAVHVIDRLRSDPFFTIVEQSPQLFQRGLELYRTRPDKRWSLTDCISFVVMGDHNLKDALTSDHDFEQAGFRALLRLPPPEVNGKTQKP